MNPTLTLWIIWIRRALTTFLTGVAFFNSYAHTVQWFTDNGQAHSAQMLSAIPEAGLILVVLTLITVQVDRLTGALLAVVGIGSLGLTLTSNLSQAGPGLMGQIAALVAPLFAVIGFALEVRALVAEGGPAQIGSAQSTPAGEVNQTTNVVQVHNTVQVAQLSSPEPVQSTAPEPVQVVQVQEETEPVQVRKVNRPAQVQRAIGSGSGRWSAERMAAHQWASAQSDWPTAKMLVDQFPDLSLSTAKRVAGDQTP